MCSMMKGGVRANGREQVGWPKHHVFLGGPLAPCQQFCEEDVPMFIIMRGAGAVVVPLSNAQTCAAYVADILHFCCCLTGKDHNQIRIVLKPIQGYYT